MASKISAVPVMALSPKHFFFKKVLPAEHPHPISKRLGLPFLAQCRGFAISQILDIAQKNISSSRATPHSPINLADAQQSWCALEIIARFHRSFSRKRFREARGNTKMEYLRTAASQTAILFCAYEKNKSLKPCITETFIKRVSSWNWKKMNSILSDINM